MNKMYASGGGPGMVKFKSDWKSAGNPSGAADPKAPQKAPFYWGIKDVQYAHEGGISPTWRMSMLEKVRKHTIVPEFMNPKNKGTFSRTPEFWFSVRAFIFAYSCIVS